MPEPLPERPRVWPWYVAYCAFYALVYLLLAAFGLLVLLGVFFEALDTESVAIQGVLFLVLGVALSIPFAAAPFLGPRPWTWVLGLVLIAIGLMSCCTLPAAIPLLIQWIKPSTQRWFGRGLEPGARAQVPP